MLCVNNKMKRALLIGINYTGTDSALNGCVNDVKNVKSYLLKNGYTEDKITLISDAFDSKIKPTRNVILKSLLDLLLSDAQQLYLHYSGHGSYISDTDGDEEDGRDECLVPLDYEENGMILDDEIKGLLCCLREDQKLFAVLDCCHSGSGMDLCYNLYSKFGIKKSYIMKKDSKEKETRGQVIMISGCKDDQTSADAMEENKYQGALTYCFLKTIGSNENRTYLELINGIRRRLTAGKYDQIACLSSGRYIDINTEKFSI